MTAQEAKPPTPRSQTEVTPTILDFLGDLTVRSPHDFVALRNRITGYLISHPYNERSQPVADSLQWKRTATQILEDGYVFEGKSCSDLTIVFLTICRAMNLPGQLVKLKNTQKDGTHSVAEIQLEQTWFSFDIQNGVAQPRENGLSKNPVYVSDGGGLYTVFAKGRDVWDLGLDSIQAEQSIYG